MNFAKKILLGAALALSFHQVTAQAHTDAEIEKDCGDHFTVGEKCVVKIRSLHPTQGAVGKEEIRRKTEELQNGSKDDREDFRKKKRIPVVVGPDQKLYLVDHHHSALSMLALDFDSAYIEVVGDLSDSKSMDDFWKEMVKKKWCYPYNGKGEEISPKDIPGDLTKLDDDPYRSIAGIVREWGGYEKDGTLFEEFVWARRFEKLQLLKSTDPDGYDAACYQAIALIQWGFWSRPQSCADHLRKLLEALDHKAADPKSGS